jgi:hypothetical protein
MPELTRKQDACASVLPFRMPSIEVRKSNRFICLRRLEIDELHAA